ncbi:MAG: dual specificity protein phosphatase family protein [Candidatus Thorarchaeota archaeon]
MVSNYPYLNEIVPKLWLGAINAANNGFLKPRNITAVLSIINSRDMIPKLNELNIHECIIREDGDAFMPEEIALGINFIETNLERGLSILVHCLAGVSRSTSIVAGYLMKKYKWDPYHVLKFIAKKRIVVSPATKTYNSVISFVYGSNKEFICLTCNKSWKYQSGLDFHYNKSFSQIFCSCYQPNLKIIDKSTSIT